MPAKRHRLGFAARVGLALSAGLRRVTRPPQKALPQSLANR
jgi:hypothetical protein